MKKLFSLVIVVIVLLAAAYVAQRGGWIGRGRVRLASLLEPFHKHDPPPRPATAPPPLDVTGARATVDAAAPAPAAPAAASLTPEELTSLPADLNLLALDAGAQVESANSEHNDTTWSAQRAIDGDPATAWSSKASPTLPVDLVLSFFGREPVFITGLLVNPRGPNRGEWAEALEVEAAASMTSPTDGFTRIGAGVLRSEAGEQAIAITPTDARYVRLRILAIRGSTYAQIAGIRVTEGSREGYAPLLARNADLFRMLKPTAATGGTVAPAADTPASGASVVECAPVAPVTRAAAGRESRNVLVIERHDGSYYPADYKPTDTHGNVDYSIYGRLHFTRVKPWQAALGMLHGKDTVVLSQICDIKEYFSESFKKALVNWVALGNKLIIQDSDDCGQSPDYSFLPYKFATSNPGARGAASDLLIFVEENTIGNAKADDPGFLDVQSWLQGTKGSDNEIGDSNVVTAYDPQWCGHLFGTNVLKKNGFMEAYAHHGKGLIIYDGFDNDQGRGAAYRQLVTRELAQPMNPDGLTCSARLGDFVITTEQRLKNQPMAPGRAYVYPLMLLSNQGYSGTIKLSLSTAPPEPGFTYRFEPDVVELTEISKATLTVTTTRESSPALHMLSVRGTDVAARSSAVCLQLSERKTGGIQVVTARAPETRPSKNLEIILDVSGSMKLPLGNKTRWTTALDVLKSVVQTLPDDFNVGLRVYSHRYPAASRETCTDTQLLLPIEKLDRSRIAAAVGQLKPRGETPLIYSILQAPADLKARGGGSVVVITDGEDTCKGDPVTAAAQLKASGLDVTLNIVGFTLKGKKVQDQLTTLAESTGGRYYGAQSGDALARALWIAAVDKFPYTIFDATGAQVAKGDAGAPPQELEPGEYKVVVKVADQELTEQVVVTSGGDVVLRVALKADRFVIER